MDLDKYISYKQLEDLLQSREVKYTLFNQNIFEDLIGSSGSTVYPFISVFKEGGKVDDIQFNVGETKTSRRCVRCTTQIEYQEVALETMATSTVNNIVICESCIKRLLGVLYIEDDQWDGIEDRLVLTQQVLENLIEEGYKEFKRLRREVKKALPVETMTKRQITLNMNKVPNPFAKCEGVLRKRTASCCSSCDKELTIGETYIQRKNSMYHFNKRKTYVKSENICLACMQDEVTRSKEHAQKILTFHESQNTLL